MLVIVVVLLTLGALAPALPRRVVAALAGWGILTSLLAMAGVYTQFSRIPPPIFVALLGALGAGVYATARAGDLREALERAPLPLLVGVQVNRLVIGILFLVILGEGGLPGRFARTAGWGDVAVGAAALALALYTTRQVRPAALLAWNLVGVCDLLVVVAIGIGSAPTPLRVFFDETSTAALGTFPLALIPTWIVPLALTLHAVIFRRLGTVERAALAPAR